MTASVFLVGAGPGDPGLLTLKAARLLERADVVVIDALVSPEIRDMINTSAELVEAGKRANRHTLSQDEINALLIDLASSRSGVIVRLKGGDPFVFGRGGEEAEALAAAGVPFEVVPGISSSIAGPAYAGIPVTHRALATSFTVVTGHESDSSSGVDWDALGRTPGTIVFLMGLSQLDTISQRLIAAGKGPQTPVAVISRATTPRQRSVTGALDTIAAVVREATLDTPALIVVGDVVGMRDRIEWFERRPLFGKRCVVTRARAQASALAGLLAAAGAEVVQHPLIDIRPAADLSSLDFLVSNLESFAWIIFSSVNGVEFFFEHLLAHGRDARSLATTRIAAVGSTTAALLQSRGVAPDLVPERFQSSALLPHLPENLSGAKIAVVRALEGNDEFIAELRARGGDVHLAIAYENVATADHHELQSLFDRREVDVVTFTSASTVDNFMTAAGRRELTGVVLASIGPMTSAALRRHGLEPTIEAAEATVESLAEAVIENYRPV